MKRIGFSLAALLLAVACSSHPVAGNAAESASALTVVPLTVKSASGQHQFRIEVARTGEEQAQGLMFREALGPDEGMIFPMVPPRHASFWMKNTLIPLDMIFVRADGTIARIEAETVPHSLEPVQSMEPVGAVLEIAGGRAAELGIQAGDKVEWIDRGE